MDNLELPLGLMTSRGSPSRSDSLPGPLQMEKQCTEYAVLQCKSALVHDLTKRAFVKVMRLSFPFILQKLIPFTANKPQEYSFSLITVFIHQAALQILDTDTLCIPINFLNQRELPH